MFVELRFVSDRQTDRWTHDDSIYRASIASRGKKIKWTLLLGYRTISVNVSRYQTRSGDNIVFGRRVHRRI